MNNREYIDFLLVSGKFNIDDIVDKNKHRNMACKLLESIKESDLNVVSLLKICLENVPIPIEYIFICEYVAKHFEAVKSKGCLKEIEDLFYLGCNVISLFTENILIGRIKDTLIKNINLGYDTLQDRLGELKIFYFYNLFLVLHGDISYHAVDEHIKDGVKCFDIEDETYDIIEHNVRAMVIKRESLEFIKDTKEIDKMALVNDEDVIGVVIANDIV